MLDLDHAIGELRRELRLRLPNLIEETSSPCLPMRFSIAVLRHFDLHTIEDPVLVISHMNLRYPPKSQHAASTTPTSTAPKSVLSTLRATRRTRHPTRTTDIAPWPP